MHQIKSARRPVIDPVLLALKSRRVIIALAAFIVGALAIPDLAAVRGELLTLIVALSLALIGGYSVEDAAAAGRERASLPPEDLRETVKEIVAGFLDEISLKG
jgi:hypothetical protein